MNLLVTSQLVHQYFGLSIPKEPRDYDAILGPLVIRVQYLLENNMETLMNVLYRIDVDENKVKAAFRLGSPRTIADALGRLILDRIIIKTRYRGRF